MIQARYLLAAVATTALLGTVPTAHAEHYGVVFQGNGVFIDHQSEHGRYQHTGHYKRRYYHKRHWRGHPRYWHNYYYFHKPRYWHKHRYGHRGYKYGYSHPKRRYYQHMYRHHRYGFGHRGWRH